MFICFGSSHHLEKDHHFVQKKKERGGGGSAGIKGFEVVPPTLFWQYVNLKLAKNKPAAQAAGADPSR